MPQGKSRKKDLRQARARYAENRLLKHSMKLAVRAAREQSDPQADEVAAAYKALDKAAKRGLIHSRTAARRKARLMRRLNQKVD